MFMKKEVNITNSLVELANNMNFNLPDKRMKQIDLKLDFLLHIMKYKDYIEFIKSDKKLKLYDEVLGKYANNETISKVLVNSFSEKTYEYLNKIIDDKIKSLS